MFDDNRVGRKIVNTIKEGFLEIISSEVQLKNVQNRKTVRSDELPVELSAKSKKKKNYRPCICI